MKILLTVVFCGCLFGTFAQTQTIRGTVTDTVGNVLQGVTIEIENSQDVGITTEKGEFEIIVSDSLGVIVFKESTLYSILEITEVEKFTYRIIIDPLSSDEILELSSKDLYNVVVISATKRLQLIDEAPSIISILTADDIEKRGYRSVGEAVQSVPGIDILYDYVNYNLGIRGINGGMRGWSRVVKVMINGQAVSFRPSSENFLGEELIPIAAIERIEVIKGPASALYGANAFLGVINIITKKTENPVSGEVAVGYGNGEFFNGKEANILYHGKSDNIYMMSAAHVTYSDRSGISPVDIGDRNIYQNNRSINDISKPKSLYNQLEYQNKLWGNLMIDMSYQELNSAGEFMDWGVMTHNTVVKQNNVFFRGSYSNTIHDKVDINLSLSSFQSNIGDGNKYDIDTVSRNWISREVGTDGIDALFSATYRMKKRSFFSFGYDYTVNNHDLQTYYFHELGFDHIPMQGLEYGDTAFINSGVYFQTVFYPGEIIKHQQVASFNITAGLRYDKHNIYDDVLNYRVSAGYRLTPRSHLKVMYGTSFNAPASVQLYSNYIKNGGVTGNDALHPERANTVEVELSLSDKKKFRLVCNAYYSSVKDKVELVFKTGRIANIQPDNVARIRSRGIDADFRFTEQNLQLYSNVSFQKTLVERKNLIQEIVEVDAELFPDVMVKGGANYALTALKLNINTEVRFTGRRIASQQNSYALNPISFRTERYSLSPYALVDFAVSTQDLKLFSKNETIFKLKVYNCLNQSFAYPGFKDYDIPGEKRMFYLNIIQKF